MRQGVSPLHPPPGGATGSGGISKQITGVTDLVAIYHLNVKTGSKGSGQSAAAKSDYIGREGKYQSGREEVQSVAHGNMPEWAADAPRLYWQAADEQERANGRLYTQVEFALPIELAAAEQDKLAQAFAQRLTGELNLPYSLAVHKGRYDHRGKELSDGIRGVNPHCHLIISERINDGVSRPAERWFRRANSQSPERGGAVKTEALKSRDWLCDIRKIWQDMANESLARNGHNSRIDHRTLEAQGIRDRLPQIHIGSATKEMHKRGIKTPRFVRVEEHRRDSQMLAILTKKKSEYAAEIEELEKQKSAYQRQQPQRDKSPKTQQKSEFTPPQSGLNELPYRELQTDYDRIKKRINEANSLKSHLDYIEGILPDEIRKYRDNAALAQERITGLQRGLLGGWRHKQQIELEEQERRNWLSKAKLEQERLEKVPAWRQRCAEELQLAEQQLAVTEPALIIAGQRERAKRLASQPEAVRKAWAAYEQRLRKRTQLDTWKDINQRERRLNYELSEFLRDPQRAQQRERSRGKGLSR